MAITTFTAAQVLTAAQMNAVQGNDFNQTVSTKTASYTLVAADKGTRVVMNVASANTVTVNTSLFSAGDTLVIQNIGAGVSTVTAGTATVSSAGPLAIPQYGSGTLYFTSAGVAIFFPSAGPAPTSGLKFITSATATAATLQIDNCFSATYDTYRILGNMPATGGTNLRIRYCTGGTPDTASDYTWRYGGTNVNVGYFDGDSGNDRGDITIINGANGLSFVADIFNPFSSTKKTFQVNQTMNMNLYQLSGGVHFNANTSFDGFHLFNSAGASATYNIAVYGYATS